MLQVAESSSGTALGSAPLKPYLHQHEAVYDVMLPQPLLRFLLADEPGTGKTIMAGLYLVEASRLGLVERALVVCPAHLVGKWQDDIQRFFGREIRRITADTIREKALEASTHPLWIVSLDLAAANPAVRQAIDPGAAGWDLVIADEAHRFTPSAQTYFQVGLTAVAKSPRALLMTATPHRGKEWMFRSLMHLTDPHVFPLAEEARDDSLLSRLRPGSVHFLRRMKEGLVDIDGRTPLFRRRTAHNIEVPLNAAEADVYAKALGLVDQFFPGNAVGLGRMVYGKRAASSLYALRETLQRRSDKMGTPVHPGELSEIGDQDAEERELASIAHIESRSAREERRELGALISEIDLLSRAEATSSKWPMLVDRVLIPSGIAPGSDEQIVVFTEYADTAEWLTQRFRDAGHKTEMYSGRQTHPEREELRARFVAGDFQVIVSTDAGNEGIDLQSARVLANWDVPWSLVTLEQRFGRIHRVGQSRDVDLYNLIALDTLEGRAHATLLDNLVAAANELDGKMFDSLALVGEMLLADVAGGQNLEHLLSGLYRTKVDSAAAKAAIGAMTKERIRQAHDEVRSVDGPADEVDAREAITGINRQRLDRVNPHMVERYLTRLCNAGLIHAGLSAVADKGLWHLRPALLDPLPIGQGTEALIATSGEAKREAGRQGATAAERAIPLGPGDKAFQDLAAGSARQLAPHLYRGGALTDPTAITDYRLHSFSMTVRQGRSAASPSTWRCGSRWSYLVKTDSAGARIVPWDSLANLQTRPPPPSTALHPADSANAYEQAHKAARRDAEEGRAALERWLAQARLQLQKLPNDLTDEIGDSEKRRAERQRVAQTVQDRVAALKAAVDIEVGDVESVGWAHVLATAEPSDDDVDSEIVAMRHVSSLLSDEGWMVADVHTEKRGYDLRALRGSEVRAIEVKGIKDSAASSGITVTGAELATAAMHGSDYWLYVVDHCADGSGQLYCAWSDPSAVFAGATQDIPALRIKGSALSAAKERSA